MRHMQIDADEAHQFQRLAGRLLYSDPSLRPRSHVLALNTRDQSGLWPYGISGDLPITLVRISEEDDLTMVRQLLRAHEYLRLKGLVFDLVVLNDHPPSYAQSLQDELQRLVRISGSQAWMDKPGGVFLRRSDLIPEADRILLHAVARVVVVAEVGVFVRPKGRDRLFVGGGLGAMMMFWLVVLVLMMLVGVLVPVLAPGLVVVRAG